MKALIARKVGMTTTIAEDGTAQAVTLLSVDACTITQVKTLERDLKSVVFGQDPAIDAHRPAATAAHSSVGSAGGRRVPTQRRRG